MYNFKYIYIYVCLDRQADYFIDPFWTKGKLYDKKSIYFFLLCLMFWP